MTSTYLTVAIPYVNAAPHLGYAYELVLADICARARRALAGSEVRFLGGTDDYSLKNVLAAEAAGAPTQDFVAANAGRFAALRGPLSLSFDDFIQTSADPRHVPGVQRLWTAVASSGSLYRRSYEGDYCVGCEQFYSPAELVAGCCPEHAKSTEHVEEENWFFRLSAYQGHVLEQITSRSLEVTPEPFRQEVLSFVRTGLEDISLSRSARRARGWGVPVPGDPTQVVYVWFDALASYISALGYGTHGGLAYERWWQGSDARVHVVGKGILRFHAVFWPAFLAAAGEPGPTRVHVHPYLSLDGAKLSKSSGVAVDPVELVERYGADALRWWFARDVHSSVDTDFTVERLVARANQDLAGGVGNVVNRVVTLVHRHRDGVVPGLDEAPLPAVAGLARRSFAAFAELDLRRGSQLIIDAVKALNRDLDATAPWQLAKDPALAGHLDVLLARYATSIIEILSALGPVAPDLCDRLRSQVGPPGQRLAPPSPGFQRVEV
jgi:methionyl-tRNA synthetase